MAFDRGTLDSYGYFTSAHLGRVKERLKPQGLFHL